MGLEALRDVFRCFATFGQGSAAASPLPSPAAGGTPPAPKVRTERVKEWGPWAAAGITAWQPGVKPGNQSGASHHGICAGGT